MAKDVQKKSDQYPETGIRVMAVQRNPYEVEAAYHFMDGEPQKAYATLKKGIEKMPQMESLWLMKLDILRIMGDKDKFEESAIRYAETLGQIAPPWRDIENVETSTIEDEVKKDVTITAESFTKSVINDIVNEINTANGGTIILNLSKVGQTDKEGIIALNATLRNSLAAGSKIVIQQGDRFIKNIIENSIKLGGNFRDIWDLTFLFMKLQDMSEAFDEFSMQFVEAFGESPPDWEIMITSIKPTTPQRKPVSNGKVGPIKNSVALSADLTQLSEGDAGKITQLALSGSLILDMRSCRKISLLSASRLSHAIEEAGKKVVMIGANYMIRSAISCADFLPLAHLEHQDE